MPITNEVMRMNTQNLSAALTIRIGMNPGTQLSCLISIKNKGVMLKTAKERTKRVPSKMVKYVHLDPLELNTD